MQADEQIKVWQSLDADSSFFGIRGRYLMLYAILAGAGILLSFLIIHAVGRFIGMIFGAIALFVAYVLIKNIQGRYSMRQFNRLLDKVKIPRFLKVRPTGFERQFNRTIPWK